MPLEPAVVGAVITAFASGLVAPTLTHWLRSGRNPDSTKHTEEQIRIRPFSGRREMYERCRDLILSAEKSIIDTTWGPDPPKRAPDEELALQAYVDAQKQAARRARYRELFTLTEKRADRLRNGIALSADSKYEARVLNDSPELNCLPDFMVVDRRHVIVSNVNAQSPDPDRRFLEIESQVLAELLTDWFNECWRVARATDVDSTGKPNAGPKT